MAIDMGPRDGDFARYVEGLTSGSAGEPGRVYSGMSKPAPAVSPSWSSARPDQPPLADGFPAPSPVAVPPAPRSSSQRKAQADAAKPAMLQSAAEIASARQDALRVPDTSNTETITLAGRAGKRLFGTLLTVVGIGIFIAGARHAFEAFEYGVRGPQDFIPAIFLFVFGGMVLRGARSLRREADRPVAVLPPLTTVSTRGSAPPSRRPS